MTYNPDPLRTNTSLSEAENRRAQQDAARRKNLARLQAARPAADAPADDA